MHVFRKKNYYIRVDLLKKNKIYKTTNFKLDFQNFLTKYNFYKKKINDNNKNNDKFNEDKK